MTATPRTSTLVTTTCGNPKAGPRAKSCENGVRAFDVDRFRAVMPDRWTAFLRQHFRSIEEIQYFFSVSERTATYWWHGGTHRPSGDCVAAAAVAFPVTFIEIFGQAA